ncbi:MAG: putative inorganic carbon transporter subunit DabA, partial [Algiphilus sp.]
FLHSYDWQSDGRGRALEIILTAPMVVAHWINSQYYFSTVDPQVFGAGSKTTQTVVGRLGVLQGNGSDLMTGLPEQSVLRPDGRPQHEPLRLLTVVYAPPERIESVIQRNGVLQRLFDNEWVAVAAIDPRSGDVRQRQPGGSWPLHDVASLTTAPASPSPPSSHHSAPVSEHAL